MKSTDAPSKQAVPFGTNGPREAITPTTPSGSNQASYDQGFPPITMTLKSAGGLPPKGQDMNQILFEQSSFNRYFAAGGGYVYDSTFSTAVGGYPLSARIPNSTGTGFWFNTVEDNQTNPENSTAALTGWIPMGSYGITTITGLASASITLTTLQASKDRIVLSGTLTANINIVVPAWVKRWEVINNCVGAFTVTIKTPSGIGVSLSSGMNASVYGDGTNIIFNNSPGALIARKYFYTSGSYTPTDGTRKIIVSAQGGGGAGGGTATTGSNQIAGGGGGSAGSYGQTGIIDASSITSVSVIVGGGGSGVINAAGNAGTASSFGSYITAPGGSGGAYGPANTTANSVGSDMPPSAACSGSSVVINIPGYGGESAVSLAGSSDLQTTIKSGKGGDSFLGMGGRSVNGSINTGGAGQGYGAGGAGKAYGANAAVAGAGSAGSGGVVIIEEYA